MEKYGKCCYCKHKRSNGLPDSLICQLTAFPIFNGKTACEKFEPRWDLDHVYFTLDDEINNLKVQIANEENTGYGCNALKSKQYLRWLETLDTLLNKLNDDREEESYE